MSALDDSLTCPWVATLVVEFHAHPDLPEHIAREMLSELVDAANAIGYVSSARVVQDR